MNGTVVLINLLGGVALLLWGLRMVRTGMTRMLGNRLVGVLERGFRNRLRAFITGLSITVALQSSTATALLTTSLAARNLVATAAALAVLLGADVGTALVAQVLSFDLSVLSPILIFAGMAMFFAINDRRMRNLGRIGLGLGLMLLALALIVQSTEPLRTSSGAQFVLAALSGEPVIAVLVGLGLTWLAHSSLAMVLLIASLTASGILSMDTAVLLVLGANAGAGLPPLTATMASGPVARRPAVGNLLFRFAGVIVAAFFVGQIVQWLPLIEAAPARQVVNFHLGFNIVMALICLPLIDLMSRLTERLLPIPALESSRDPSPVNLDRSVLDQPAIALSNATLEVVRMGDVLDEMLREARQALVDRDTVLSKAVIQKDDVVDDYYRAIKSYLADIDGEMQSRSDSRRCMDIMNFTTHLEHVGDIISLSLAETVRSATKAGVVLKDEEQNRLLQVFQLVEENLRLSLSVFLTNDKQAARRLMEQKFALRQMERSSVEAMHQKLQDGEALTSDQSALGLDILRDLRHINSHLTTSAYPILEDSGELRTSRLKPAPAE